ncbi:MAG: L,D-transpeptidase family protein, partial [Desulfotignum sp.]|nr:L,D-transpeptidase family protein [Desulfotignum sp.]
MTHVIWLMVCLLTAGVPALAGSLPAAVIALPRGEHAILVEKQTQRFYLYQTDSESSQLIRVFATNCSTGEASGPKQVEGDKKTPEGIYFIIDAHEDKDLTPIYGPRAFPTDY